MPGLSIPFTYGEVHSYHLTANSQYNDRTVSYSHWQLGGNCWLPSGIGWKAGGSRAEVVMTLQAHNTADIFLFLSKQLETLVKEWKLNPGLI